VRQSFGSRRDDGSGLLAPPSPGNVTPSASGSSLFAPGSGGYEPWGGGISPGAYTPGGSPLGGMPTAFRSAIPQAHHNTALRTPPPPQRRASGTEYGGTSSRSAVVTPSGSPRGPTISLGLPTLNAPPQGAGGSAQIRRKTSALAFDPTTADSSSKKDD
jgi:hypothetical protein